MRFLLQCSALLATAAAFADAFAVSPTSAMSAKPRLAGTSSLRPPRATASGVQGLECKSIAVIGATGGCGLESVYQGLAKGYTVRALCRSPEKLVVPPGSGGEARAGEKLSSDNLEVIQGDVTSLQDVQKLLDADDIEGVVVALGGRTKEVGTTMLTDGTNNVIETMKSKGLKKVSIVTSIGSGDSYDQAPIFFKFFMWTILKDAFVDKNKQEGLFMDPGAPGSDLDYVIVRPGGLGLGPPTGQYKVLGSDEMAGSIARADVADFCLQSILEDSPYKKQAVCIS